MPGTDDDANEAVSAAADQLYGAPIDDFMSLRTHLAKTAKADGDAAAAKAITALRKPTVPASVVNRHALSEPTSVERLTELGDRLRRAHHDLDATRLRELSAERRGLVAEITAAAFAHAELDDPPTAQRDEVSASFDAAVADPEIAARLGRLLRPEHFSGFGIAPGPGLTLVQGGGSKRTRPKRERTPKTDASEPADRTEVEPPQRETATSRRLTRAAAKARTAFDEAEERLGTADAAEKGAQEQVRTLTAELGELQKELDTAKIELDRARKDARTARTKRRESLSALDRAERHLNG